MSEDADMETKDLATPSSSPARMQLPREPVSARTNQPAPRSSTTHILAANAETGTLQGQRVRKTLTQDLDNNKGELYRTGDPISTNCCGGSSNATNTTTTTPATNRGAWNSCIAGAMDGPQHRARYD
jgi:hypothetical protein